MTVRVSVEPRLIQTARQGLAESGVELTAQQTFRLIRHLADIADLLAMRQVELQLAPHVGFAVDLNQQLAAVILYDLTEESA